MADGRALVSALEGRSDRLISMDMPIDHSPQGWKAWMDVVLVHWSDHQSR
ncbi:MAG: hypothetical protein QNJ40_05635 [Xanthomonadales bacterium]|nr:hypothetical protein [Xanthomonadales bacterium]